MSEASSSSLEEGSSELGLHLVPLGLPLPQVGLQLVRGEADQGAPLLGGAPGGPHPGALQALCRRGSPPAQRAGVSGQGSAVRGQG